MKRSEVIPLIKEHGKGKGVDSEILPKLIVEEILRHDKLQSKDVDMKEITQTVRKFLNKFIVQKRLRKSCTEKRD